jgi:peroxiredoxin
MKKVINLYYFITLHVIIVLLLILSIWLLIIINKYNEKMKTSNETRFLLQEGDSLKIFRAKDLYGNEFIIPEKNKEYLLFIFSASCSSCVQNIIYWKNLERLCKNRNIKILGISISDNNRTKNFILENNINFTVIFPLEERFEIDYKIQGVPQTLLVSENGILKKIYRGILDENSIIKFKNLTK